MLPLPYIALKSRSFGYLERWQKIIDDEPDYESQIKKAKATWGKSNKTFDEIKEKLRLMSNMTYRCSYCEDSVADEIEHIYPKNIYPGRTFVWMNYLYSCGQCNGRKSNNFALVTPQGFIKDITPPSSLPDDYVYVRPDNFQVAFIDPRQENPTQLIDLDILSTFRFRPAIDLSEDSIEYLRADYTIKVLMLNEREYLPIARRQAYRDYRARLAEYITLRDNGANQSQLDELIEGIKEGNHYTVWVAIKKWQENIDELNILFNAAPEALNW